LKTTTKSAVNPFIEDDFPIGGPGHGHSFTPCL